MFLNRGIEIFISQEEYGMKRVMIIWVVVTVLLLSIVSIDVLGNNGSETRIPITLYVGYGENYTSVQEAVNIAQDGDTVFVYAGTYYENLAIVDKSINLVGEGRELVRISIKGYGNIIQIEANYVNVSGLNISNSSVNGIEIVGSFNKINNNTVSDNYGTGIHIDGVNNIVRGNKITNNSYNGIYLTYFSDYNVIDNNLISNNGVGINLWSSEGNTISNNTITDNRYRLGKKQEEEGCGILFNSNCGDNILVNNTLLNNSICSDSEIYQPPNNDSIRKSIFIFATVLLITGLALTVGFYRRKLKRT